MAEEQQNQQIEQPAVQEQPAPEVRPASGSLDIITLDKSPALSVVWQARASQPLRPWLDSGPAPELAAGSARFPVRAAPDLEPREKPATRLARLAALNSSKRRHEGGTVGDTQMLIVHVQIHVNAGDTEAFRAATVENAR